MPSKRSSKPSSSTSNTPNVYLRRASSNGNGIPLDVLRAQLMPEQLRAMEEANAHITPEMLHDMTPDRMFTMDLTEMAIKAKAQADGSEEAIRDANLILERLQVLKKAHTQFQIRPMLYQESNLNFERLYQDLYDDIMEHPNIWFDKIFYLEGDPKYAERTVGIIGTLATILRQRGCVDECLRILELDTRVLKCYQDQSALPNVPSEQTNCCRALTYKYYLIKVNAHIQKGHKKEACTSFRKAVEYELEENYNFDQQTWAYVLPSMLGKDVRLQLAQTSDTEIWQCLQMLNKNFSSTNPELDVALRKCAQCGIEEDKRGDHKICSKCKVTVYCSRSCQTAHWKAHKKCCCKV